MIKADQPTIFPGTVRVAVSSIEDGSMKDGGDLMTPEVIRYREAFLQSVGMPPAETAVFFADYQTEDFCHYETAKP